MKKKNLIQQSINAHLKPVLKKGKNIVIASALTASVLLSGCANTAPDIITELPPVTVDGFDKNAINIPAQYSQYMTAEQMNAYIKLNKVSNATLTTHKDNYRDNDNVVREYTFVSDREELIAVNKLLADAIEDYFKAYGASNWTNPDQEQFWPKEVELLMTAIAWRETEYRIDAYDNKTGCAGITGLNKTKLLETLQESGWLQLPQWGDSKPYINCNSDEIDIFNPVKCLEYSYYNMGYNLANRLKKDKFFYDKTTGNQVSIWQKLEYSEEMQLRLIISSHLFGITNVVDSVFERNYDEQKERYININEYIYSEYTNDVLKMYYELCDEYEVKDVVIQER